jgi:hypothetical protein
MGRLHAITDTDTELLARLRGLLVDLDHQSRASLTAAFGIGDGYLVIRMRNRRARHIAFVSEDGDHHHLPLHHPDGAA